MGRGGSSGGGGDFGGGRGYVLCVYSSDHSRLVTPWGEAIATLTSGTLSLWYHSKMQEVTLVRWIHQSQDAVRECLFSVGRSHPECQSQSHKAAVNGAAP